LKTVIPTYTLLFLLLLPFCLLKAQEEERNFDAQKLENLWSAEDFDQGKKGEEVPFYGSEPLYANQIDETYGDKEGRPRRQQNVNRSGSGSMNGADAQLFMYVVAGFMLGFIVFLVLRRALGGSGKKLMSDNIGELVEGDIQALDTKGLIAQAVANQDYRLAVRLNYLDILKKLDQKNWIAWAANKTNQDYVRELSQSKYGASFSMLTYHFDHAWYGDFRIEEKLYKKLETRFQEFHHNVGGNG